jgi:glycosyltransferase involved in cell wall biosynthesis
MRVLMFSQYYPPEVGATQNRMYAFARHLADEGHDVTVIAHVPNHPKGVIFDEFKGKLFDRRHEDGVAVCRVWVHASQAKSSLRRLTFYFSYALGAFVAALFVVRSRPDVVIATSPPLPVLLPAAAVSALYRRPYVADIRDLWPSVAVALGELKEDGCAARIAASVERFLYRRAAAITVTTRSFLDHVERNGGHGKTKYVPNGTDTDVFTDQAADPRLREELGLAGSFVVGYFGNHGIAQGLEALVDAAVRLSDRTDVVFLCVGEGPVKADLAQRAADAGAQNVWFMPQVPTEEAPRWIAACDLLLVPLADRALLHQFVPSKMFDFLACSKPVVLMAEGEARQILEQSQGGWHIAPENADQLAALVRKLADEPEQLAHVGRAGQTSVRRHYTRQNQAAELSALLRSLASLRRCSPFFLTNRHPHRTKRPPSH